MLVNRVANLINIDIILLIIYSVLYLLIRLSYITILSQVALKIISLFLNYSNIFLSTILVWLNLGIEGRQIANKKLIIFINILSKILFFIYSKLISFIIKSLISP